MFWWVKLLNVYGIAIFYFKIINTLDFKMEMNVIVGILPHDFNQHILRSVINPAMEIKLSLVVILGG